MGGSGAYLSDEAGPARWVVLAGAAAIVVIALTIGWLNSRKPADVSQARREPVTVNPAFIRPTNPASTFGMNPAFGYGGLSRPTAPSANYSPQVRWAYVPPANPAPVAPRRIPESALPPEPTPPPMMLAANPIVLPQVAPPRVDPAPVTTPAVPFADTVPEPGNYGPGVMLEPTSSFYSIPYGPAAMPAPPEEVNRTWVYDPVQERYVLNPERIRRGGRSSAPVRRNMAPVSGGPVNPATGRNNGAISDGGSPDAN